MTSLRVPLATRSIWRSGSFAGLVLLLAFRVGAVPANAAEAPSLSSSGPAGAIGAPLGPMNGGDDVWVLNPSRSGGISGGAGGGGPVAARSRPGDLGGFGANARVGHLVGQAVGRRESGTYLNLAPFLTYDDWLMGVDLRLLRPNDGNLGGSGGFILRHYNDSRNSIFGANVYYDVDDTRGRQFEQVGVGIEWLSAWLDVRANGYIPTGEDRKVLSTGVVRGSEQFVGNNLIYDRYSRQVTAASGADLMLTVPVPGQWAEAVNLEASAGAYWFSHNDARLKDFVGGRLRVDGSLFKRLLHMYVEYSNDRAFDNNVSMGVDVNYWNRFTDERRIGGNQYHRLSDYVRRNWTVVAVEETAFDYDLTTINPVTGTPYYIEHVDTNAAALFADGSFERPYVTLQNAQTNIPNPPNNIIYVHSGSRFTTPLVMNPNEIILGEGVSHELTLPGVPDVVILPGTGKTGGRPEFDGISGVPVTLASNTTFGGFVISQTSGGPAIFGNNITNSRLVDIDIEDVNGGHGIHFLDSHGRIILDNVNILRANPADPTTGVDLDSFRVEGGDANITYGNSVIENTSGRAVRITGAAGRVDMRTTRINSRFTVVPSFAEEGVIVQDSSADVLFGPMDIQGGTLDLQNISGDITFTGPVQLSLSQPNPENPTGIPLRVDGSSGNILFAQGAPVTILSRGTRGIDLRNISGTFRFSDDVLVAGGSITPALVWQQNSGAFFSDADFIAGDVGTNLPDQSQGILIGDRAGALSNLAGSRFTMNGQFTIVNTFGTQIIDPGPPVVTQGNSAIEILNDPTNVTFNGGLITGRNPTSPARAPTGGIEILNTTGTIVFNGTTLIENEPLDATNALFDPPSGQSAVEIIDAVGPITFDILNVLNANELATGEDGIFVDNSGDITFNELNIRYFGTAGALQDAVHIQNSGVITSRGGFIDARGATAGVGGATAIRLLDNDRINWTSDTISTETAIGGIVVQGNPGHFIVRGLGGAGSGGNITNAGAIFDYTGTDPTDTANFVELHDMVFFFNNGAVTATNLNRLLIDNTSFDSNFRFAGLGSAIQLSDVVNFRVEDSTFTSNTGTALFATVGINPADTTFNYQLERNQFVDPPGITSSTSMIRIDNVTGGVGAVLDLLVRDNGSPTSGFTGFVSSRNNPNIANPLVVDESSTIAVRWNGPVTRALFQRNSFSMIGGVGQEAVEFFNASSTGLTNFHFLENAITTNEGGQAVGVKLDLANRANVQIVGNETLNTPGRPFRGIRLNGVGDEAFRLTLRGSNNLVRLEDNEVQGFNDDQIAFHFPYIGGNTQFFINGNDVTFNQQFASTTGRGERGFHFGPIVRTMFFNGDRDNTVRFLQPDAFSRAFPDPFTAPSVGSFILNGVRVPTNP